MGHDLTKLDDELLPVVALVQPVKLAGQPRRRRRKMFAIAEPLESRTMLSAVAVAFEGIGVADLDLAAVEKPAIAAQVDVSEFDQSGETSADQPPDDAAQAEKLADSGQFRFGASSAPAFDGLFGLGFLAGLGLAANSSAASATPSAKGTSRVEFNSDAEEESDSSDLGHGGDVVELRLAGSGQVVAYGSSRSLQDDAGQTVGDSDGPTTYVRSTDADGRSVMRLVFVQKGPRAAAPIKPQRVIADSVVVAEADLDSTTSPAEPSERATLCEVATALDTPQSRESSHGSQRGESTLLANSNRIGIRATPTQSMASRTAQAQHRVQPGNAQLPEAVRNQNAAIESTDDENQVIAALETSELAASVFHPQPKYLVLAMLIVGTLARPFSRVRRALEVRRIRRLSDR